MSVFQLLARLWSAEDDEEQSIGSARCWIGIRAPIIVALPEMQKSQLQFQPNGKANQHCCRLLVMAACRVLSRRKAILNTSLSCAVCAPQHQFNQHLGISSDSDGD